MPAMEPLCHLIGIDSRKLSKEENIILEAELFSCLCAEVKKNIKTKYKTYFNLMKFTEEMESAMLNAKIIYHLMQDILSAEEYSLAGISNYTQAPEEVIYELAIGHNTNPSLELSCKVIDLHRFIRRDLYVSIIKKIIEQYLKE